MTSTKIAKSKITPMILSGGAGTRLWPMSTNECPKQFLPLLGDKTMFQMTLERVTNPDIFAPPIIVGSSDHAQLMGQQLAEIGSDPGAIILEPVARNTAPAVALAALAAGAGDRPILVMPSDHVITDLSAFLNAVELALPAATEGWLVTFGIQPTRPETGYGYIAMSDETVTGASVYKTEAFIEKPDRSRAMHMLKTGQHVWNAGIFLFRADKYLSAMQAFAPEMLAHVKASFDNAAKEEAFVIPDLEHFAKAESNSIDYTIMEKTPNVATIALGCGWSDVGTWDALGDIAGYDKCGNNFSGEVISVDSKNCLVRANGVRISLCGVQDLVVVSRGTEVMIVPRGETQLVKKIAEAVALRGKETANI